MRRKRYKNWWYNIVERLVRKQLREPDNSLIGQVISAAMAQAYIEAAQQEHGVERIAAIHYLYNRGWSVQKTAQKLYYSERTVQQWGSDFINSVGNHAGFASN